MQFRTPKRPNVTTLPAGSCHLGLDYNKDNQMKTQTLGEGDNMELRILDSVNVPEIHFSRKELVVCFFMPRVISLEAILSQIVRRCFVLKRDRVCGKFPGNYVSPLHFLWGCCCKFGDVIREGCTAEGMPQRIRFFPHAFIIYGFWVHPTL
jgi:hypothetical protein